MGNEIRRRHNAAMFPPGYIYAFESLRAKFPLFRARVDSDVSGRFSSMSSWTMAHSGVSSIVIVEAANIDSVLVYTLDGVIKDRKPCKS